MLQVVYRVGSRLDDLTIAVSRNTAARFGRWPRSLVVIPNGVRLASTELELRAFGPSDIMRVGLVGRLTQEKDFPTALEGVLRARHRLGLTNAHKRIELHVYGDGPLLNASKRLAERASPRVAFFHGWVPQEEIAARLSELSALILASREEGFPYVILEAMAVGCPVVAAAVGGVPEIVRDGETGLLAKPGDPESLAQALVTLATSSGLSERLARRAAKKVQGHSLDAMVDAIEQAYYSVRQVKKAV